MHKRAALWRRLGIGLSAPLALALAICSSAVLVPASAQATEFEKLFAANCTEEHCGIKTNGGKGGEIYEPSEAESIAKGFRTAGGFTPAGVTAFRFTTAPLPNAVALEPGVSFGPVGWPLGSARYLRTDVAPGVATNPFATGLERCSQAGFNGFRIQEEQLTPEYKPELFVYPGTNAVGCPQGTTIGRNRVLTVVEASPGKFTQFFVEGIVYNVEPLTGFAATYGVAIPTGKTIELEFPEIPKKPYEIYTHTIIEGNVEWGSNYHDYFEINKIPPGLIESRLIFYGRDGVKGFTTQEPEGVPALAEKKPEFEGERNFIRNPTSCSGSIESRTTQISGVNYLGESITPKTYTDPVGTNPATCLTMTPFSTAMGFALTPETTVTDAPDGVTTETKATHPGEPKVKPDISDLKSAEIKLPPGMTMNPSAAAGLEGCTPHQIGIGSRRNTECPAGSRIGSVTLEVPTLPAGSLKGAIYLGKPEVGSITAPPYTIYLDAESARFGVKVRLKGTVTPNPETGQLTTTFTENPEQPFNDLIMQFNGGNFAPLANPVTCGSAASSALFLPFSGEPGTAPSVLPFTVRECASPQFTAPPLSQSLAVAPDKGGSTSNFTFTITRPQGQEYLSQMKTVLPPGLVAKIPSVPRCTEANANAGTCPTTSKVGTVQVQAGSGSPFTFTGNVFLTEKYEGGAYGLDIVTPTEAGPFNFGPINTRAKINVNEHTAQVEVTIVKSFVQGATVSGLPTIIGGIPTRIRSITVSITHSNYIINPTNCSALKGESFLSSTLGLNATVPSGFQVEGCSSLAFSPKFTASTAGNKASRANGASLGVNITQNSDQANIASVITTLPKQLPSRLTTLQKACLLATFEANPASCPKESDVGTASAVTPTLPDKMTGKAYIVSRGAAFPDLELVLEGDGVRVILDGKTNIKNSITTTTFGSNPDVPISSFALNLPTGKYSLLAANGNLCKPKLVMPTTLTGQNGKAHKQKTQIQASGCLPILRHKVEGHKVIITVKVPQGGRVRFSGEHMGIVTRFPKRSKKITITLPLTSPGGLHALRKHHNRLKVKLRVGFIPKAKNGAAFTSYATVTFH